MVTLGEQMNIKRSFKNFLHLSALFSFLVILQGCSGVGFQNSAPLTKSDKIGIVAYNLASTVDMLQTREIQSNPAYTEMNPLIGDSDGEILAYFLAKSTLHYSITRLLPQEYRPAWLTISIVPTLGAIHNNHTIGVDMKF